MKIAILTPQLSQGGAEKMVYQLARGLKALGDEVVVFSSGGYYREQLLEEGIDAPLFPLSSWPKWFSLSFWSSFSGALQKGNYEVWHVQTIPLAFLIRFVAWLKGLECKTILTLHGSPEWKIKWVYPLLKRLNVKRCAVSGLLAQHVHGEYIPNAVDCQHYSLKNNRVSMTSSKTTPLRIMIVARLVPEKGIDLWLKALKILKDEGIYIHTLLAGEGPEREKLQKFAKGNRLSLQFLGWVPDPWKFSQDIDLFVLPSRREGEPLALLEAMASLLPILATAVGGVPRLLEENRGILVEPTPEALAQGVREFLNQKEEDHQSMLERANAFVRLRTWEGCVHSYRKQYELDDM